jgi:hypothetical protein
MAALLNLFATPHSTLATFSTTRATWTRDACHPSFATSLASSTAAHWCSQEFTMGAARLFTLANTRVFARYGTSQVFAVPSAAERKGIDTTTFPGDTLTVPVSPAIAPLLARYPLPNDPHGAFGARTYATSSKVVTNTDQFSVRVDQVISDKATLFGRFSFNQVNGPTTNPDQTTIDPSFAVSSSTINAARPFATRKR